MPLGVGVVVGGLYLTLVVKYRLEGVWGLSSDVSLDSDIQLVFLWVLEATVVAVMRRFATWLGCLFAFVLFFWPSGILAGASLWLDHDKIGLKGALCGGLCASYFVIVLFVMSWALRLMGKSAPPSGTETALTPIDKVK